MARRRKGEGLTGVLKPYGGYARKAAEAIFTAFPDWVVFAQAEADGNDEAVLSITVPDPVANRGHDLRVSANHYETLVVFDKTGTHAHLSPWKKQTDEEHFAEVVSFLRRFIDEKSVYYSTYKNGLPAAGGGCVPATPEGLAQLVTWAQKSEADEVRVYSWQGTHDTVTRFGEANT